MRLQLALIIFVWLFFSCSETTKKTDVDILVFNGRIYSVDSGFTIYEAMVVKDGKILDLNTNENILRNYSSTDTINLQHKTVFPGFIDAHCHFLAYGLGLGRINLVGTKSFDDVLNRVKQSVKPNADDDAKITPANAIETSDSWIVGRGWDQNDWGNKMMPDKAELDKLFPHRPVFLSRIDGHAALVNSVALKQAGITFQTKISGGEIVLKNNEPSGLLIDNAVDLVKSIIPQADKKEMTEALLNAQTNCFTYGLTTVDDAGLMASDIDLIDTLQKRGTLKMRLYAMLSDSLPNYNRFLKTGPYKTERLTVCSFKFYADGALGSRGACLKNDYNDKPNWKGFLLNKPDHFSQKADLMLNHGFQMNAHCIGDSAYYLLIRTYRNAEAANKKKSGETRNRRWRIEHAQVVDIKDLALSEDIIPSVQPTHATSDMYWAAERLGKERVKNAYAYKDLVKACGKIALGTDFPVEDISPFKTFYAAVARQDSSGYPSEGFQIENALTREETLRGMSIWAAYANFEETAKGSLEKGKVADFIVLDTDIMTCKLKDVLKAHVIYTYVNGEKVFERKP